MDQVLSTWKEIANYLGKGVRTVQRWEKTLGLPIHRPGGPDHSAIMASTRELSEWMLCEKRREKQQNRIKTILLVDDDGPLLFTTRALLEAAGFIVVSCNNAERAAYVFDNGPQIDLLLTDVDMPGMSGIEVAQRLTAKNAELLVIIISGITPDADAMVTMERHNWTFLAKPASTPELLTTVTSALNANGQQQPPAVPDARVNNVVAIDATPMAAQRSYANVREFKPSSAA